MPVKRGNGKIAISEHQWIHMVVGMVFRQTRERTEDGDS